LLEYLVTGAGRCGTHYVADALSAVGIPTGHEVAFGPAGPMPTENLAETSWLAAPFLDTLPTGTQIVHLVRNPAQVVASLLRLGFFGKPRVATLQPFIDFAYEHCPSLRDYDNEHARTAGFVVEWNRMIERSLAGTDAARVCIEDGLASVFNALEVKVTGALPQIADNTHAGGAPVFLDTERVPADLLAAFLQLQADYGYRQSPDKPMVYWTMLFERTHYDVVVERFGQQCAFYARPGFQRLSHPYARTDSARNQFTRTFMECSARDDDVMVMLDGDHLHPVDIVLQLAQQPYDVIGAAYRMRHPPHNLAVFVGDEAGKMSTPTAIKEHGVARVARVGTGAIAIRRRAFRKLVAAGEQWPFFRYEYPEGMEYSPTEDMYFSELCDRHDIGVHVDTRIWTDHLKLERLKEEL